MPDLVAKLNAAFQSRARVLYAKKRKPASGQGTFREADHPRAPDGRFGDKSGESAGDDANDEPFALQQPKPAFKPFEAGSQSGKQPKLFTGSHSDLAGQASLFDADSATIAKAFDAAFKAAAPAGEPVAKAPRTPEQRDAEYRDWWRETDALNRPERDRKRLYDDWTDSDDYETATRELRKSSGRFRTLENRTLNDWAKMEEGVESDTPAMREVDKMVAAWLASKGKPVPEGVLQQIEQKTRLARMFDRAFRSTHYRGDAERWITIGGGTHVKIDGSGRIVSGPGALKGRKLDSLGDKPKGDEKTAPKDDKPFELRQGSGKPKERPARETQEKLFDPAAAPKVGPGIAKVADLHVDPERFQYKLNTNKSGVTSQFSDVRKFNPELAGTLHVWTDPENGKTYVVNGHHRHELAERSGYQGDVQVYHIDAPTAEAARARGAIINIAGGNGTAIDAAKYMRDTGTTADEMAQEGVSLKGKVAEDAVVLARLSDGLFRKVALGTYRQGRAIALARHLENPEDQDRVDRAIEQHEKKTGRDVSDGAAEEMAREANLARRKSETTRNLFGEETNERNLFVERGELKSAIRRDITAQLNAFRAVASEKRADVLSESNTIDAANNKRQADRLEEFLWNFDREARYNGPLSDAINRASEELADAPKRKASIVKALIGEVGRILAAVPQDEPGGTAGGPAGSEGGDRERRDPIAGQRDFFARGRSGADVSLVERFDRAFAGRGEVRRMARALDRAFYSRSAQL